MTELEALNLAKAGEETGFNYLYEAYNKQILIVLSCKTNNVTLIKDLAQITWLKIYKNLCKYDADCSMKTWVSKIATNSFIDHYRANLRWKSLEEMVENGEHFDEAIECDDTEEIKDSARERISGIHHILQALPQTHQDVIKLFSQGLEWKAIGKTLNIPTRTVVSRMYYARKTIKKHLSPPKEQESIEEIGRKFNNT